jgi:uncharacterized protein (DUF2236 family)
MNLLQRRIWDDFTQQVGRHDARSVFAEPAGDLGLMGGPDSVSWKINADTSSIALAGIAAIVMELLHPSVMAGVGQQSNYREQPFRRARTTFGWVITNTFGSTKAAEQMIARVKRMHEQVNGTRDDGVPYRALDPELIAWVHTCIPWLVMTAYERYNAPLTTEEKDRYLTEQSVVGLMSGADEVPTSVAELDAFVEHVRPKLGVSPMLHEFFDFLLHGPLGAVKLPKPLADPLQRLQVESGISLMPRWAQEMTGFDRPESVQRQVHGRSLQAYASLLRWSMPTPPWVAMANDRTGVPASSLAT